MSDILSGGKEESRTPEEKAMTRLRNWLIFDDRPQLWSGSRNPNGPLPWSEMVCILAGVDPEASADADAAGLAFLPGALESYGFKDGFPRDPEGLMDLNAGVADTIGVLAGFRLSTMSPQAAITKMINARFPIPWLRQAMADPVCEPHLPKGIPADFGERLQNKFNQAQKAKNAKRLETDDMQVLIRGVGRQTFDALKAEDFAGCRFESGGVNGAEVARRVAAAIQETAKDEPQFWPKPRALENWVRRWRE